MREIKYRVWNKRHNKMYEVYAIHFNEGLVMCKSSAGTTHTFGMIDLELMQYAGLKDKEGKDIYEGDILYIAGVGECVVEFDCCGYWAFGPDRLDYQDVIEDIERIIGNIHESPDLMDKQN